MLRGAFTALLAVCQVVILGALGEEDGDALCFLQRDVVNSMPSLPEQRPRANYVSHKRFPRAGPRYHRVLASPSMNKMTKPQIHMMGWKHMKNRVPSEYIKRCTEPGCKGRRRAEDHLAADVTILSKQKQKIQEYIRESESLLDEVDSWRRQATSYENKKEMLQTELAQIMDTLDPGTHANRVRKKARNNDQFGKKGSQRNRFDENEMHKKDFEMSATTNKLDKMRLSLQQDAQKKEDIITNISATNKGLEEQVGRMRVTVGSMVKEGQRLTTHLTRISKDKIQLQSLLDNFKDYVKKELHIANASVATNGMPMKKEMHKLSKADVSIKSIDANQLQHHMRSCQEELRELETYLREQLDMSYMDAVPKNLTVTNLTALGTSNARLFSTQNEQVGTSFWKKLAENLMAETLPLEKAIDKLTNENKRLFIENQQLEKNLQQP